MKKNLWLFLILFSFNALAQVVREDEEQIFIDENYEDEVFMQKQEQQADPAAAEIPEDELIEEEQDVYEDSEPMY